MLRMAVQAHGKGMRTGIPHAAGADFTERGSGPSCIPGGPELPVPSGDAHRHFFLYIDPAHPICAMSFCRRCRIRFSRREM